MGIFSRLTDIVNSNINSILDRAQDPEKIIRLIIQEMEDTLVEVRSGAVRVIAESLKLQERQVEQISAALAKQNEDIGKLQAKLADAKARERTIVARTKSAAGRVKIRSKLYDERITDAFARFEQVERSLDELEGKAEVYDLGRKATLGEELAGLEAEAGIDEELAALKKRLGNSMGGNSMGGNSVPGGSSKADGR